MRVQFLEEVSGFNGNITWRYRKGEKVDAEKLPSGEASAYRWLDMSVVRFLEDERAPQSSDAPASPVAAEEAPVVAQESRNPSPEKPRRGRPPKNQSAA